VNDYKPLRIAISVTASLIAAVHLLFPNVKIDGVTLGLVALAALPWLAPLIKSIELPGIGKVELQGFQQRIEKVEGATESANSKAEAALSTARAERTSAAEATGAKHRDPREQLQALASEYEYIRETQDSGPVRTDAMTEVVGQMMALVPRLDGFEVLSSLKAERLGLRLAAYVYLYVRPDYSLLVPLVESVTKLEPKPFGQYWGLQAILKALTRGGTSQIPATAVDMLNKFSTRIPKGTDRYYELHKILAKCEVRLDKR